MLIDTVKNPLIICESHASAFLGNNKKENSEIISFVLYFQSQGHSNYIFRLIYLNNWF